MPVTSIDDESIQSLPLGTPNIFDQFDTPTPTIAPDGKNPFDAFDGNVFDQFDEPTTLKFATLPGNIKINPLQQVQMQSLSADKGIDPENSGATLANLLRDNDDVLPSSVAPPITAAADAAAPVVAAATLHPQPSALADTAKVAVRRPNGEVTTIPAIHLKAAMQYGYKPITQ